MDSLKADRVLNVVTVLLCAWLILASIISIVFGPVDRNAGFFIPMAQLVRQGYVPSVDFWNPYTPGSYYLYALLGEGGLRSPLVCKIATHLVLLAYGLTLFATLRTLGHRASLAAFFASAFSVWIYTLGAWSLFDIDVLESLLVLASFLCLLKRPTRGGAALGGLIAGCALMVKQYAVLFLPLLALWTLFGKVRDNEDSTRKASLDWLRPILFLACVGVPFLAFVAVAGKNPVDLAIYFATWGGQASTHGWNQGIDAIAKNLTMNSATTMVICAGILLVTLIVWRRQRFYFLLAGMFLAGVAPLLVREFSGYALHAAPWVMIVCATFAADFSLLFADRKLGATLLALLTCLPLAQYAISGMMFQARAVVTNPAARQRELVRALDDALPSRENVLLVNKWWLYPLADLHPPLLNYNQMNDGNLEAMRPARDEADYIAYSIDDNSLLTEQQVQDWIGEASLFEPFVVVRSRGDEVVVYSRQKKEAAATDNAPSSERATAEPATAN